ncbi:MAG: hypothetical protein HY899_07275 [Deltaproteobacteria bacterium]|nr:hypothetical protein [Deltaproteobacteria bacterium]
MIGAPKGYWSGPRGRSHRIAATRWLIEQRLGWSKKQVERQLLWSAFEDNGLGTLIHNHCGSIMAALKEAYPGRFKASDLRSIPDTERDRRDSHERAVPTVRWLVEDALGWSHALVRLCLSDLEFRAFAVHSMLKCYFGSSFDRALEQAYPDRYRPGELCEYRRHPGFREPLFKNVFAMLGVLLDAGRDEVAARQRHRISTARLLALRKQFAARGVRGLLLEPKNAVTSIDTQLAIRDLTYRQPLLTEREASRELRERGIKVTPEAVLEMWRSHRLLAVKERYRWAKAADAYTNTASCFRLRTVAQRVAAGGGLPARCAHW